MKKGWGTNLVAAITVSGRRECASRELPAWSDTQTFFSSPTSLHLLARLPNIPLLFLPFRPFFLSSSPFPLSSSSLPLLPCHLLSSPLHPLLSSLPLPRVSTSLSQYLCTYCPMSRRLFLLHSFQIYLSYFSVVARFSWKAGVHRRSCVPIQVFALT